MTTKTDRRCKARTKRGPCKLRPILGGLVCHVHGGAAPQVKRKAAERLADLIDPDRALREMARLAYSDLRDLFDAEGKLKPMKDWPDHAAASIKGIEVMKRNLTAGDGVAEDVVKITTWDKVKALEMLAKHMGLLVERMEHSGQVKVSWADDDEGE